MVGRQESGEVVVTEQGVEITKRLEADEYELPSIEFAIESERSDLAEVRLVDPVPEETDMADIGFHPDHGAEYWGVENDAVIFERTLEPGEGCYTLYGIGGEASDPASFLVEPDEVAVERSESGDGESPSLREDIPDIKTSTEGGDGPSTADTASPITLSLDRNSAEGETNEELTEGDQAEGAGDIMEHDTADVLDELVAEVQARESTDEQVETLRESLLMRNGSIDARLEHLQSEVSELEAYTTALEEFLDENGTGRELIEDFQNRLTVVVTDVGDLKAAVSDHEDQFDSVGDSIDELSQSVEATQEELEDVNAELESQLDDVKSEISDDDLSKELGDLQTEVRDIRAWQEQVIDAFGSALKEDTDSVDS